MRRFFRVHRDEDYGQIQYLTVKCLRLTQEKAVFQHELLVSRERLQALQAELESVSVRLCHKEQLYVELNIKYEELLERLQQQQEQRVVSLTEDRLEYVSLLSLQLQQVSSDLLQLQGSETQLMGLLDELHQEAQLRAKQVEVLEMQLHEETLSKTQLIEDLEMQLNSKSLELVELQMSYDALRTDMCDQRSAHQRTVEELQRDNSESLGKLRETAEQFEWLCEQQRRWMCCVKRFKECLSGEKESLELQVNTLQVELDSVRRTVRSDHPIEPCSRCDVAGLSDLQAEVDRWKMQYEDLLNKLTTQQVQWAPDVQHKPP
ncbi:hyaluronan mediated motility receptor [Xyrauchen texanus]|uniref:hyaluronan mediated motility receptor n=1 Tax=Xyrauchen texanus TaxID=154827 RepID=UPI002241C89F|nr:hyaluronan mediated motility receptor [Xyrauchen texanus]XP_052010592.1 hyaluronan mediated motility receptor [Xyrauchen texanus]XP_052010594.1 hyaluronan mediated motility receptor [Xyrauchen texanus]